MINRPRPLPLIAWLLLALLILTAALPAATRKPAARKTAKPAAKVTKPAPKPPAKPVIGDPAIRPGPPARPHPLREVTGALGADIPEAASLADLGPQLDAWKAAGCTFVRLRMSWQRYQPANGPYQWGVIDKAVDLAQAKGLGVVGVLGRCAVWASRGNTSYKPQERVCMVAGKLDFWSAYVTSAVRHFKNRVRYWQIWEQPSIEYFRGTRGDYQTMVAAASAAARAEDPTCRLILPDAGSLDLAALDSLRTQPLWARFDIVGLAPASTRPADLLRPLSYLPQVVPPARPVWITDWQAADTPEGITQLAKALTISRALGVARAIVRFEPANGAASALPQLAPVAGALAGSYHGLAADRGLQAYAFGTGSQTSVVAWDDDATGMVLLGTPPAAPPVTEQPAETPATAPPAEQPSETPPGGTATELPTLPTDGTTPAPGAPIIGENLLPVPQLALPWAPGAAVTVQGPTAGQLTVEPGTPAAVEVAAEPVVLTGGAPLPLDQFREGVSPRPPRPAVDERLAAGREVTAGVQGEAWVERGLYNERLRDRPGGAVTMTRAGDRWALRTHISTDNARDNAWYYLDVDDSFVYLDRGQTKLEVVVEVRGATQPSNLGFSLLYDSTSGYRFSPWVTVEQGPGWFTYTTTLTDASFANRAGYDFRLSATGSKEDMYLSSVTVRKIVPPAAGVLPAGQPSP